MSDHEEEIDARMELVQIAYSEDDPDGEQGRAGPGWYFRFPGDDSWDGTYDSHDRAEESARRGIEEFYDNYDDMIGRRVVPAVLVRRNCDISRSVRRMLAVIFAVEGHGGPRVALVNPAYRSPTH